MTKPTNDLTFFVTAGIAVMLLLMLSVMFAVLLTQRKKNQHRKAMEKLREQQQNQNGQHVDADEGQHPTENVCDGSGRAPHALQDIHDSPVWRADHGDLDQHGYDDAEPDRVVTEALHDRKDNRDRRDDHGEALHEGAERQVKPDDHQHDRPGRQRQSADDFRQRLRHAQLGHDEVQDVGTEQDQAEHRGAARSYNVFRFDPPRQPGDRPPAGAGRRDGYRLCGRQGGHSRKQAQGRFRNRCARRVGLHRYAGFDRSAHRRLLGCNVNTAGR